MKNKLKTFGIGGPLLVVAVGMLACSATPASAPALPHVTAKAWYVNVRSGSDNDQFISFKPDPQNRIICTYKSGYPSTLNCTDY